MDGSLGPHTNMTTEVSCVVDSYGPVDLLALSKAAKPGATTDRSSADSTIGQLLGGAVDEHRERAQSANPMHYISTNTPPFLILHGSRDPVVPINQSRTLHEALQAKGVPSTMITIDGGKHGRGFGPETQVLIRRFFDHHLRDITTTWADQTLQALPTTKSKDSPR